MLLNNYFQWIKPLITTSMGASSITVSNVLVESDGTTTNSAYKVFSSTNKYAGFMPASPSAGNFCYVGSLLFLSNLTNVFYNITSTPTYASYAGVILGDGDTAPTADDYALAGNIITDFTATTAVSAHVQDGHMTVTATYTLTNTGANDITIREYGVRITRDSNTGYALIIRDVFETPITIAPGNIGTVVIQLDYK